MTLSRDLLSSLPRWSYGATPDRPYPPFDPSWVESGADDGEAAAFAPSLLGALPAAQYTDVVLPSGHLYRFFAFPLATGATAIGALRYLGEPESATLGDAVTVNFALLDRAAADIQTQKGGAQAATDAYVNGSPPDYPTAVQTYQALGNAAVSSTGIAGEIDGAGAPTVTQPYTQQAWNLNSQLSQIGPSAGLSDAQTANGLLSQMFVLYGQAITAARAAGQPPPTPAPGTATPSAGLVNLAHSLVADLTANGCRPVFTQSVSDFQVAYNAEGQVFLSPDGLYGDETSGAVQRVLDASGGGSAPPGCVGTAPAGGGGGTTPTAAAATTSSGAVIAAVSALVVVAGVVIGAATGVIPNPFKP